MNKEHTAYLSVGANMGEPLENCKRGIQLLETRPDKAVKVSAFSRFYKTQPVDYTDQNWFINAVVRVETRLGPLDLLGFLKQIEKHAGRTRGVRFGPRMLDLDVLLYDDHVANGPDLILPHPRMHKRRFVLVPFCDIDPHVIHPVLGLEMGRILETLDEKGQRIIPI